MFWIALGATVGVLVVRRAGRFAEAWTPDGLSRRTGDLGARAAEFWAEVRAGAAEREAELRALLDRGRAG